MKPPSPVAQFFYCLYCAVPFLSLIARELHEAACEGKTGRERLHFHRYGYYPKRRIAP